MKTDIKCYDSQGKLTFDLHSHSSRVLKIFGADIKEATHTFSDDEMGGGTIFWYTVDPTNINPQIMVINIGSPTHESYRYLVVEINGNQIYFKKTSDILLYVGVRA